MGRGGDWWSDLAEAWGWTMPVAATMPIVPEASFFNYSIIKLWEIRMNERGAGILLQNCHSLLSIHQI